jgi:hypothetical protein
MGGGTQQDGAGEARLPQVYITKLPSLGTETEIFSRRADTHVMDAGLTAALAYAADRDLNSA